MIDKKDIAGSKNNISKQKKSKEETNGKPVSIKTKKDNKPEASTAIVSANSKTKKGVVDDKSKNLKTDPETIAKQDDVNQSEVKPDESKIDSAKVATGVQEKNVTTKKDTLLKADPVKETPPQTFK